ncbi:MAG: hypothetical protein RIE58_11445 [Vicingaceae bacterium]
MNHASIKHLLKAYEKLYELTQSGEFDSPSPSRFSFLKHRINATHMGLILSTTQSGYLLFLINPSSPFIKALFLADINLEDINVNSFNPNALNAQIDRSSCGQTYHTIHYFNQS